jgi:hypothetical protein
MTLLIAARLGRSSPTLPRELAPFHRAMPYSNPLQLSDFNPQQMLEFRLVK